MNKIYLITGPAGVGKSTISLKMAEKLEKSVLLEGDDIYHFIVGGYISPWKEGNYLDYYWHNILDIMKNSLDYGFDIVYNHIMSKEQVEDIKSNFPNAEIKFVCLMVDEETIVKRDKLRAPDRQMGERSLILLKELQDENFDSKNILDSSNLNEEQTMNEILNNNRFVI